MFYSYDILQKRGKFGIIWLAATSRCRITRRDIVGVNVVRSSEDVINILTLHETLEKHRTRLSLYLSSQLMYGLAVVQSKKSSYLLEEARFMLTRLSNFKLPIETCIDLKTPTDKFKVTFEPPDMEDASPDFGRLEPFPEPSEHLSYEYFQVTTPRSSEEWVITPGSHEHDRAMFEPVINGSEALHTSFHGDITMEEADNEEPIPLLEMDRMDVDFLAGPLAFDDLPPAEQVERGDLPEMPPANQLTPPQDEPIPPPRDLPSPPRSSPSPPRPPNRPSDDSSSPSTPRAPIAVGVDIPPAPQQQQDSDVAVHSPTPPVRRRRRTTSDDDTFILDPVVDPTRRRRRRRRLIIDPIIVLNREQIENNMRTANERLTIRRPPPSLLEPANSLLKRLSSRNVASAIQNLMNRFKTLPEPNRTMDSDEEEAEEEPPAEEPIPVTVQVPEEESSMEARRAGESLEAGFDPSGGGIHTSSSLRVPDASSGTLHVTRDLTTSPMRLMDSDFDQQLLSDQVPFLDAQQPDFGLGQEDFMEAQPMEEVIQPDAEVEEEIREELRGRPRSSGAEPCHQSPVSPERIPPPSSYESLTPELEEMMAKIRCKADETTFSPFTSFSEIIEEISPTRRNVASMFHLLLCLHTQGRIHISQVNSDSDIIIEILPEEEGFLY